MSQLQPDPVEVVIAYHERTKHHFHRYANALGYLDWAAQPNPFRIYPGAPRLPLDQPRLNTDPTYDSLFTTDRSPPHPLNREAVSRLFYESLAISAWKQAPGTSPWSLRINPSSGALHPTEGYLISGPIQGLSTCPGVYHYAPIEHALEERVALMPEEWAALAAQLPRGAVLLALTSIYWRESWKYGERAFRYCHHDLGHAIGTVSFAAATLGWRTRLLEAADLEDLAVLLGIDRQSGMEAEHPDCVLALSPIPHHTAPCLDLPRALIARLAAADLAGRPNRLSSEHHPWPVIDEVLEACRTSTALPDRQATVERRERGSLVLEDRKVPARPIIRQRRSAVALDARTAIDRGTFYRMLTHVIPSGFPFDVLPWRPRVALALFVHRVDGLEPGLYLLMRHPAQGPSLRSCLRPDFAWRQPPACPPELDLVMLDTGDARRAAELLSCHQEIAADGAFSLGMLAALEPALREGGAAWYPRLFWETGLIGQVLYLEAEAAGIRGTGIGCFFDDAVHELFGIPDRRWQSLYHFTVGGAIEDPRLKTIAPYAHLGAHLGTSGSNGTTHDPVPKIGKPMDSAGGR